VHNLRGQWDEAMSAMKRLPAALTRNLEIATKANAITVRDSIKKTIYETDPRWAPNAPLTIAMKGSSRPLIQHGDFVKNVEVQPLLPGLYFVGWKRGVKNQDGIEIVNIARVLIYGKTIYPKKAKALTLPVSKEAAEAVKTFGGIRKIPGLFHPRGTRVLAKKQAGGGFETWFIFLPKVIIPPRDPVTPGVRHADKRCYRRWKAAVKASISGRTYGAT